MLQDFLADLRIALRTLRRRPVFTLLAVATLSLQGPAAREILGSVADRDLSKLRFFRATARQIALAFLVRRPAVLAIPKTADPDHLDEIIAALEVTLQDDDLAELDATFPPPRRAAALSIS